MQLIKEIHFDDFSLYFMSHVRKDTLKSLEKAGMKVSPENIFEQVIELTHNHGTENDTDFKYHNGNSKPFGFCQFAFLVDDLASAMKSLSNNHLKFNVR